MRGWRNRWNGNAHSSDEHGRNLDGITGFTRSCSILLSRRNSSLDGTDARLPEPAPDAPADGVEGPQPAPRLPPPPATDPVRPAGRGPGTPVGGAQGHAATRLRHRAVLSGRVAEGRRASLRR